jgi:hypothetical protein
MTDEPRSFYIASRRSGDVNTATTPRGTIITRESTILIPELADYDPLGFGLFECVPYDTHFVYKNPDFVSGVFLEDVPPYLILCTCGFPASVVWGNEISADYQFKIACHYDCMNGCRGLHATADVNIREFKEGKYNGRILRLGDK